MMTTLSKEKLEELKAQLRKIRGYRKAIAEKTERSLNTVDKVLAGEYYNQKIILAALEVLEEAKTAQAAEKAKIKKVLK